MASASKNEKKEPKSKHKLTEEELESLQAAFVLLDTNKDGKINVSELQFMLRKLEIHVQDEVVHELLTDASHTGNDLIDEAEFFQWISRIEAVTADCTQDLDNLDDTNKDLLAAFRVFDRDKNGYITLDELKLAMEDIGESVTDSQLNELLTIADIDKDGKINYEEFARMLS